MITALHLRHSIFFATLLLVGCASNPSAPVEDLSSGAPRRVASEPLRAETPKRDFADYRVASGDTLYAIAFRRGVDFRDLAAWNGIAAPYRIYVGQELRMSAPSAPSAAQMSNAARAVPDASKPPAARPVLDSAASGKNASPNSGAFEELPPQRPNSTTSANQSGAAAMPKPIAPTNAETPALASDTATATPQNSAPMVVPKSVPAPGPRAADAGVVGWHWPNGGKVVSTYAAGDMLKTGIDIAGNAGDPVLSAADGEVVYSGNGLIGYGELVIVKHNDSFLSAYGHNRKRLVQEHDRVKAGQPIAEMGSSSAARDELHFEIRRNGKPVNPLDYLPPR